MITYRGSDLNRLPSARGLRPAAGAAALANCGSAGSAHRVREPPIEDLLWWRRARVTVLPSGVDPEVFRPERRKTLRGELGWREEERVVLFNAGRDARNKRLDLAEECRAGSPAVDAFDSSGGARWQRANRRGCRT